MAANPLSQKWNRIGDDHKERATGISREINGMTAQEIHEHAVELFAVSQTYSTGTTSRQETLLEAVSLGLFATFKQNAEVVDAVQETSAAGGMAGVDRAEHDRIVDSVQGF